MLDAGQWLHKCVSVASTGVVDETSQWRSLTLLKELLTRPATFVGIVSQMRVKLRVVVMTVRAVCCIGVVIANCFGQTPGDLTALPEPRQEQTQQHHASDWLVVTRISHQSSRKSG
jgi:hypothetical protein